MPKVLVVTNNSTVVDEIDLTGWNLNMPIAKAVFIEEILEIIARAEAEEDEENDDQA